MKCNGHHPLFYLTSGSDSSPVFCSVSLYIGGFFVFIGLVIHRAATLPIVAGASKAETVFSSTRLGLLAAGGYRLGLVLREVLHEDGLTFPPSLLDENKGK